LSAAQINVAPARPGGYYANYEGSADGASPKGQQVRNDGRHGCGLEEVPSVYPQIIIQCRPCELTPQGQILLRVAGGLAIAELLRANRVVTLYKLIGPEISLGHKDNRASTQKDLQIEADGPVVDVP
jgi:hypothetical protein